MKKFLMAVAALALVGSVAFAGPNAGGTIFVHNASVVANGDMCGQGTAPASCVEANTELDNYDITPWVWKVYAAFKPCTAPRLKAMSLGITYDQYENGGSLIMTGSGPCIGDPLNGAAEFPSAGWPGSGGGNVLVWQYTQTATVVEAYWFAGYSYPYGTPSTFALGPNPDPVLGGVFADDAAPPVQDNIVGYGFLGFNQPGGIICPDAAAEGACCVNEVCTLTCEGDCAGTFQGIGVPCDPNPCLVEPTGACCINNTCFTYTERECMSQGGEYKGNDVPCSPDPCNPTPTKESTWGQIKAQYR